MSEARAAWDAARKAGWGAIVSARSGESEDVTIVHLAVGWGVPQLKVGSFARSERIAKWNEGLRIEEALGRRGRFAGRPPSSAGKSLPGKAVTAPPVGVGARAGGCQGVQAQAAARRLARCWP